MQIPSIRVPVKKPDDLKFSTRVAVAASMQAIGSTVAIPTGADAERTVRGMWRLCHHPLQLHCHQRLHSY